MRKIYSILIFFLLLTVCLLPGCFIQGDYQVDLPNGYRLVRSNSYDIAIFGPEKLDITRVIPPLITAVGVSGDLVFGKVEDSHDPWLQDNDQLARDEKAEREKAWGYFLINTKTHDVQLGLTKEAWLGVLKENGIQREPKMRKPSWLLKYW